MARQRKWRMAIHLAESAQEFEMFMRCQGDMFDWLRRSQRDMSDCGQGSPVQHLERCGALRHNLLAIHVNYLAEKDAALLERRRVNVVHCPRSHSYFRHDPFPLKALTRPGINLCLGTDSLASVQKTRREVIDLNLFQEMRAFAANYPEVAPKRILQMVTINAARALGLKGQAGELSPKSFADLIAVPFSGKAAQVYEGVVHHAGDVAASMIEGKWTIPPTSYKHVTL
jgi:cytosine/adenosine deaminase-related metal-dependent hydrolase